MVLHHAQTVLDEVNSISHIAPLESDRCHLRVAVVTFQLHADPGDPYQHSLTPNLGINNNNLSVIYIKNINVADDKNGIDNITTKYFLVDNRNVAFTRQSLSFLHNTSLRPLHFPLQPISSCHSTLYQMYSRQTTTLQCSAKQTT
jgi:hypothetical protein